MIYFDNAATSHPKPGGVGKAIASCLESGIGNPGRSGHALALKAARLVFSARETLAGFFNIPDCGRLAFTQNATHALNAAIHGILRPGDHVLTTAMEHNSVMRPLHFLKQAGVIDYTAVPCPATGQSDPGEFVKAVRPDTKLIVINHASNVCGAIQPVAEIKRLLPDIPLLLDAAQSAGSLALDVQAAGIDMLAFSGHKGLMGPTGTGGLYIRRGIELAPFMQGGTGSRSESLDHPDFLPDLLEAGTANVHGIAGLAAAVKFLEETTIATIRQKEMRLTGILLEGLSLIPGVTVYGPNDAERQTATIAINLKDQDPADVALRLDREYGICTRASLHCAPLAHRTLGSYPQGSIRLSLGYFNTEEEVSTCVKALEAITRTGS